MDSSISAARFTELIAIQLDSLLYTMCLTLVDVRTTIDDVDYTLHSIRITTSTTYNKMLSYIGLD